jgi:hypothetical protein
MQAAIRGKPLEETVYSRAAADLCNARIHQDTGHVPEYGLED